MLNRRARISLYVILIGIALGVLALVLLDTFQHFHTLDIDPSQEYWLHVPRACTPERACPVLVFVHGTGGSGRDFIKLWREYAEREHFIVVCPTFSDSYLFLRGQEDEALLDILSEVRQQYAATNDTIVSGFSGGAQFAHRFAFAQPQHVRAVAVHAAGSYDPPPAHARHIPFLVTVGLDDWERVDLARWFVSQLQRTGYNVSTLEVPNIGHALSQPAIEATLELLRNFN